MTCQDVLEKDKEAENPAETYRPQKEWETLDREMDGSQSVTLTLLLPRRKESTSSLLFVCRLSG